MSAEIGVDQELGFSFRLEHKVDGVRSQNTVEDEEGFGRGVASEKNSGFEV